QSYNVPVPGANGNISGQITGAGTGVGQMTNVNVGGVSATISGNGGPSAPFSGTAGGQSVSSSTVNGVTTVTLGGNVVATCGYSSCTLGSLSPIPSRNQAPLTQTPNRRTWGFYQPGDPRPVTVFRLGEQIPFMPNVPDPGEVGPGNWYSYGYNAPPPPEPEDP